MTFTDKRDEAAKAYQTEDFKNNPDGYSITPYCNTYAISTAYEAGADWARAECEKWGLSHKAECEIEYDWPAISRPCTCGLSEFLGKK